MAKFINNVKLGWLKGVEGIGTFASNLASNAKFKMAEINLETRRREVMAEFTQKAYDLWQTGTQLPEPLSAMLQEASDLDERLSLLRAQRYAAVGGEAEKKAKGQGPEDVKEEGATATGVSGSAECNGVAGSTGVGQLPAEPPQEGQAEPAGFAKIVGIAEEKKEPDVADEGHQGNQEQEQ